jgi:hypothetical protein
LLREAFSPVQDELDLIGELVKLRIGDETTIFDDATQLCTEVMINREKAGSVTDTGGSRELDRPAEPVGVEAGRVNGIIHDKSHYGQAEHAGTMVQGAG